MKPELAHLAHHCCAINKYSVETCCVIGRYITSADIYVQIYNYLIQVLHIHMFNSLYLYTIYISYLLLVCGYVSLWFIH